jgi:hypothetical protein
MSLTCDRCGPKKYSGASYQVIVKRPDAMSVLFTYDLCLDCKEDLTKLIGNFIKGK